MSTGTDASAVIETQPFAARVEYAFRENDEDAPRVEQVLVVVWAPSLEAARVESGLVYEEFHPATDDELDEWRTVSEATLRPWEIGILKGLIFRETRNIGRKRVRDRERGRWDPTTPAAFDGNLKRAVRLMAILEKLEAMIGEEG